MTVYLVKKRNDILIMHAQLCVFVSIITLPLPLLCVFVSYDELSPRKKNAVQEVI